MTYIKARPTVYEGIKMRSRLEAAYAQWLDRVGYQWEYEPNAFGSPSGQYLPDFYIHLPDLEGSHRYVEVKPPNADLDAALARMHIILASEPDARLNVVTSADYVHFEWSRKCVSVQGCGACDRPKIGKLGDLVADTYPSFDVMACGRCGETMTHLRAVEEYDPIPSERRLSVSLTFECETCGGLTVWDIRQYKGETHARYEASPATVGDEPAAPTN